MHSNPFSVLATPSVPTANVQEGAVDEESALAPSATAGRLKLADPPLDVTTLPDTANLLAVSNATGLLAAGTNAGFILARLEDVRRAFDEATPHQETPFAPLRTVNTPSRPVAVHFASKDTLIVVSLQAGGIAIYPAAGLADGSGPQHVFEVPLPVALLPNPAERADLLAVLTQEGRVSVVNLATRAEVSTFAERATAFCWSVLGKQIIVGTAGCVLQQYTPEGELKGTTQPPPGAFDAAAYQVNDIRWLENHVLLVSYGPQTASPEAQPFVFAVVRTKEANTFIKLDDPSAYPAPGFETRQTRRLAAWLKDWPPYKHLVFLGNASSNQLATFTSNKDSGVWAMTDLDEDVRVVMPATSTFDDTCPIGMGVDLTSSEGTQLKGSSKEGPLPPAPVLLAYSSSGVLTAWAITIKGQGPYPGLLSATAAENTDEMEMSTPGLATSAAPSPFGSAPAPAATSSPFGGASTFGKSTAPSPFGASTSASPFGSSTLGQSGNTGFGQTAFGQTGFGQSGFGQTGLGSAAAFGRSSLGQSSSFGAFSKPATGSGTPAPSAFAASASGKSAFGGFAATSSSTPSPFGGASTATPTTVATSTPAFGQFRSTSTSSAFGGSSAPTAAGFGFGSSVATPTPATPAFATAGRGQQDDEDEMADDAPSTSNKPKALLEDADDLEPTSKSSASGLSFGNMGLGQPASSDAQPKAFSGFGTSFGSPSPGGTPFGKPAASAFGASTTTPNAFSKPPSTQPTVFGGSPAPAFSAPPASTAAPPAPSTTASAFGSSGFGSSGFGSSSTNSTSPLGKSGFTGFGSSSPSASPAGGSSAFSAFSAKAATFGSSTSTPPAEASKSAFAGFCAGKSSFGSAPAESNKPAASAFGAPAVAKPSTSPVPEKPATSAFGSSATGSSPFGAPTTTSAANASAFASSSTSTSPFAAKTTVSSPFGGFGSSQSRFASAPKEEPKPTPAPAAESKKELETVLPDSVETPKDEKKEVEGYVVPETPPQKAADLPSESKAIQKTPEQPVKPSSSESTTTPPSDKPAHSAKSLFGLASSPPSTKVLSLAERLGPPVHQQDDEETDDGSDPELPEEEEEELADGEELAEDDEWEEEEGEYEGSIEEELLEGEEDEEEEGEEAEEPLDDEDRSATPTPAKPAAAVEEKKPSLLERMSPLPPASAAPVKEEPKSASPFSFKPAAPAPVATSEPTKISNPFGSAPAPAPAATTASAPAPFSFAPVKPAASPAPKTFPGFGAAFGSTVPRASSPLASSAFTAATPEKPVKPALPAPEPPKALSFAPAQTAPAKPAKPAPAPAPLAAPQMKAPPPVVVSLEPKSVPNVTLPATPKPTTLKKTGDHLVDQHLELISMMTRDLAELKASLARCRDHSKALAESQLSNDQTISLAQLEPSNMTLGDLPHLAQVTAGLGKQVDQANEASAGRKRKLAELQAQSVKIQQKEDECGRYLKAKQDPDAAKRVKARGLAPEQAENQRRLRRSSQLIGDSLAAVEAQVARLKERIMEEELGRPTLRAPSLDAIQRAVRNISTAVATRSQELEDMTRQLSTLSTRDSPRRPRDAASPSPSPSIARIAPAANGTAVSEAGRKLFEASKRNAALQEALIKARDRPVLTRAPAPPPPISFSAPPEEIKPASSQADAPQLQTSSGSPSGIRAPAKIEFSFSGSLAEPASSSASSSSFSGRARTASSGHHRASTAVKIKPMADDTPPKPASSFDWGSAAYAGTSMRPSSTFEGLQAPIKLDDSPVRASGKTGIELSKTQRIYSEDDEGSASEAESAASAAEPEFLTTISEKDEDED